MSWFGSASKKTTIFYVILVAMASLVVGMVIASRLDMSQTSSAQTIAIPATNSARSAGRSMQRRSKPSRRLSHQWLSASARNPVSGRRT